MDRICTCGAPIKWRYNKTGLCHSCNARSQQGRHPIPEDFREYAHETNEQLAARFDKHPDTIKKWKRRLGIKSPRRGGRAPSNMVPMPADFADNAKRMTRNELARHYGRSDATIRRLLRVAGIEAMRRQDRPKVGYLKAPVDRAHRDLSRAGMAADFLRYYGGLSRCDADGAFNPNGDHWRRGSTILTADEVIARAEAKGWRPDAWREVRAA